MGYPQRHHGITSLSVGILMVMPMLAGWLRTIVRFADRSCLCPIGHGAGQASRGSASRRPTPDYALISRARAVIDGSRSLPRRY